MLEDLEAKAERVWDSCQTPEQLAVAERYHQLAAVQVARIRFRNAPKRQRNWEITMAADIAAQLAAWNRRERERKLTGEQQ